MDGARAVELLKALGDDVRWGVVTELRSGTVCACDLSERLGVAPSLLSHHLGVLRSAGIVTSTRSGRRINYDLVAETLIELGVYVAAGTNAVSAA